MHRLFQAEIEMAGMIAFLHPKAMLKVALAGLFLITIMSVPGAPGSSSEAGEYYTRKRVNGVWIKGHFKRKSSVQEAAAEPVPIPPDRPSSPGDIAHTDTARTATTQTGTTHTDTTQAGTTQAGTTQADITYIDPAEDHPPAFQRAAEARQALKGAEWTVLADEERRLLPLQRALLAKARAMAQGRSDRIRSVKAVTFDFETGLRRNLYSDGSVVEEPFDPTTGAIGPLQ